MALSKTVEIINNFGKISTLENTYIRVSRIAGNKSQLIITVETMSNDKSNFYFDKSYEFTPDLSASNFIAQAYEYLKSLPEFSDAVDC
jgi:hypothetical protein